MKLKVLALAVAASVAFPMAAQAEFKISGDVGVGYDTSTEELGPMGSNFTLAGSQEIGGITYFGNADIDLSTGGASADDLRVGMKGGFGSVTIGDTDNACDLFDPGPAGDYFTGGMTGSCVGDDNYNITYQNTMGPVSFGVSHNPGDDELSAIGAKFSMGGFGINLGYETGDGVALANTKIRNSAATVAAAGEDDDRLSYGITGSFSGVSLNVEGNNQDMVGVNAAYTMGATTVWLSHAIDDGNGGDGTGAGVIYTHGNMDYILEHNDPADKTVAALRYRF